MREIALLAGINPSLVPYHFQTKEHLYKELIDVRARWLNERRETLLTDLEELHAPGFPPLEAVFECFVHPVFELKEAEPGAWSKFTQLLFNEAGSELMREVMQTNISPIFRRFATILQHMLPSARRADIIFILEMTLQTTVIASPRHARIMLDDQLQAEWSDEELETRIVQSMTAAARTFANIGQG